MNLLENAFQIMEQWRLSKSTETYLIWEVRLKWETSIKLFRGKVFGLRLYRVLVMFPARSNFMRLLLILVLAPQKIMGFQELFSQNFNQIADLIREIYIHTC